MAKLKFLNTNVDNITMEEAIQTIEYMIKKRQPSFIVTPNIDHIVMIEEDAYFKEVYDNADLVLTDGQPLIWISKFKHHPIKEKISGSDLFPNVCTMAAKLGYSIFILGAAEGVAKKAADNLIEKNKGLNIVGTYSPSFGFETKENEVKYIIDLIREKQPDILAVSLGSPKGEKFIYRHLESLSVPVSMSIGASVDFEAGNIKRAPKWMSHFGLEWFYRMIKEPKRLFKRYWKDARKILLIMMKYK